LRYLLDTCAWLRLVDSPESLSADAQGILSVVAAYPVGLATISIWEVARKESLGKLSLSQSSKEWLRDASNLSGISSKVYRLKSSPVGRSWVHRHEIDAQFDEIGEFY